MRRTIRLLLVLVSLSLIELANAEVATQEPKPGDRSATGHVIIYVLRGVEDGRLIPVELKSDYGFMILNVGDDTHPKPLYRLASRVTGSVEDFQVLADFNKALAKLPRESVLHHYDKCSVPLSSGLKFDWSAFKKACKRSKLRLVDDPIITCNCPR